MVPTDTHQLVNKARQHLFPLRRLKRFGMGFQILKKLHSCTIAIFTGRITTWYGNGLASDNKVLQRVVRTAQYVTGAKHPAMQDLYTRRCQRKALKTFVKDSNQVTDCSLCYPMASGTGAPRLEPTGP
jgi:gmma-aminobutyric acid receptor subunit gamma